MRRPHRSLILLVSLAAAPTLAACEGAGVPAGPPPAADAAVAAQALRFDALEADVAAAGAPEGVTFVLKATGASALQYGWTGEGGTFEPVEGRPEAVRWVPPADAEGGAYQLDFEVKDAGGVVRKRAAIVTKTAGALSVESVEVPEAHFVVEEIQPTMEATPRSRSNGGQPTAAPSPLATGPVWYRLNRQASDDVNARINTAVARMSFTLRPIMRGRLRSTNQAALRLAVWQDGADLVYQASDPLLLVRSAANGTPVMTKFPDGRSWQVSSERGPGGRPEVAWEAEDLRRVNVVMDSPDGRVRTLEVTIRSPRLPTPMNYKLVYDRETTP
ncbi:MAG: hypothetical protein ACK46X_21220 [Candidatus Sericytochromatia bacterium]